MEESLFDERKGRPTNFSGANWLGFKIENFILQMDMGDTSTPIKQFAISYLRDVNSWIMPPEKVQLWGSNDTLNYELLTTLQPAQPDSMLVDDLIMVANIPASTKTYRYYKLEALPVKKLPEWHSGAGLRGHIFLDEVFIYRKEKE